MTTENIATNWYYVSALVLYVNDKDKTAQEAWAGIIPVDADKITGAMLNNMTTFVMKKFAEEHDIKKAEQFKAVTLLGVSYLGHMTPEEFQAQESSETTK